MNKLIDRYAYDVVRRLPEKDREDVKKELTANILDMLPEDFNDTDVKAVLESLGSPSKLAEQYRSKPRYLISPANFDNYIMVLKIAMGVAVAVAVVAGLIGSIFDLPVDANGFEVFGTVWISMMQSLVSAAVAAFMWVTVIFAIMDFVNVKQDEKKWTVSDLPDIPQHKKESISKSETIVGIVFTAIFGVFFVVMLARYPHLIAWYEADKPIAPLFNESVLTSYIPFMIFFTMFSLAVSAVKLIYGRWNVPVLAFSSVYGIASAIFTITFISTSGLFNQNFLLRIAELTNKSLAEITGYWNSGIRGFIIFIVVVTAIEILSNVYKTFRSSLNPKTK